MAFTGQKLVQLGIVIQGSSNLRRVFRGDIGAIDQFTKSIDNALIGLQNFSAKAFRGLLLGAAGVFLSFLGGSTLAAGNLEAQLQRVRVVTAEAVPDFNKLTSSLLDTSGATGLAAEKMAMLAEQAGTAGLAAQLGQEGMAEFVDTVAKFSVVSGLAPEAAAKTFTELTKQLKLSGQEIPIFASALQAVGKQSISGTAQVANFVKSLIPLKRVLGFSNVELLGLAGAVKNFGSVSQEVLRTNSLKFFQIAIKNADKFAQVMGFGSGPTAANAVKKFIDTDPSGFMIRFIESLARLKKEAGPAGLTGTIQELGLQGSRLLTIFAGAIDQTDAITTGIKVAEREYRTFGKTLDEDFGTLMNSLNKQLGRLWTNLKNITKVIGLPFLKPLTFLVRALADMLLVARKLGESPVGQALIFGTGSAAAITLGRGFGRMMKGTSLAKNTLFGALFAGEFGRLGKGLLNMFKTVFNSLSRATGTGAIIFALTSMFVSVFGVSLKRVFSDVALFLRTTFGFLFTKGIKVEDFIALTERGLLNPVKATVILLRSFGRFFKGLFLGFFGFESFEQLAAGIDTLTTRLRTMFDVAFDVFIGIVSFLSGVQLDALKAFGLTPQNAEEAGRAIGKAIREIFTKGIPRVFSLAADLVERLLSSYLDPKLAKGIVDMGRTIGNFFMDVARGMFNFVFVLGKLLDVLKGMRTLFGENIFRSLTEKGLGRLFGFDLSTEGGVDPRTGTMVAGTASEVAQGGFLKQALDASLALLKAGALRGPTILQEATGAPLPTTFGATLVMDSNHMGALAKGQAKAVGDEAARLGELRGFRTPGRTLFGGPRPFSPDEFTGGGDQ